MTNVRKEYTIELGRRPSMVRRYEYFNPNPKKRLKADGTPYHWHKGDCTTRALCKALNLEWKDAFKLQCEEAMKRCTETNATEVYNAILLKNGYKKGKINQDWIREYHCRPTVRELVDDVTKNHNGCKMVVSCTHHLVAAEDGVIYDVWNSGGATAWSFYYKE